MLRGARAEEVGQHMLQHWLKPGCLLHTGEFEEQPEQLHAMDPAVSTGLLPQTAASRQLPAGDGGSGGGGGVGNALSSAATAVFYYWQGGR